MIPDPIGGVTCTSRSDGSTGSFPAAVPSLDQQREVNILHALASNSDTSDRDVYFYFNQH